MSDLISEIKNPINECNVQGVRDLLAGDATDDVLEELFSQSFDNEFNVLQFVLNKAFEVKNDSDKQGKCLDIFVIILQKYLNIYEHLANYANPFSDDITDPLIFMAVKAGPKFLKGLIEGAKDHSVVNWKQPNLQENNLLSHILFSDDVATKEEKEELLDMLSEAGVLKDLMLSYDDKAENFFHVACAKDDESVALCIQKFLSAFHENVSRNLSSLEIKKILGKRNGDGKTPIEVLLSNDRIDFQDKPDSVKNIIDFMMNDNILELNEILDSAFLNKNTSFIQVIFQKYQDDLVSIYQSEEFELISLKMKNCHSKITIDESDELKALINEFNEFVEQKIKPVKKCIQKIAFKYLEYYDGQIPDIEVFMLKEDLSDSAEGQVKVSYPQFKEFIEYDKGKGFINFLSKLNEFADHFSDYRDVLCSLNRTIKDNFEGCNLLQLLIREQRSSLVQKVVSDTNNGEFIGEWIANKDNKGRSTIVYLLEQDNSLILNLIISRSNLRDLASANLSSNHDLQLMQDFKECKDSLLLSQKSQYFLKNFQRILEFPNVNSEVKGIIHDFLKEKEFIVKCFEKSSPIEWANNLEIIQKKLSLNGGSLTKIVNDLAFFAIKENDLDKLKKVIEVAPEAIYSTNIHGSLIDAAIKQSGNSESRIAIVQYIMECHNGRGNKNYEITTQQDSQRATQVSGMTDQSLSPLSIKFENIKFYIDSMIQDIPDVSLIKNLSGLNESGIFKDLEAKNRGSIAKFMELALNKQKSQSIRYLKKLSDELGAVSELSEVRLANSDHRTLLGLDKEKNLKLIEDFEQYDELLKSLNDENLKDKITNFFSEANNEQSLSSDGHSIFTAFAVKGNIESWNILITAFKETVSPTFSIESLSKLGTPLQFAIMKSKDDAFIDDLLKDGIGDFLPYGSKKENIFHTIAQFGDEKLFDKVIKKISSSNNGSQNQLSSLGNVLMAKNSLSQSPILCAIEFGKISLFEKMIECVMSEKTSSKNQDKSKNIVQRTIQRLSSQITQFLGMKETTKIDELLRDNSFIISLCSASSFDKMWEKLKNVDSKCANKVFDFLQDDELKRVAFALNSDSGSVSRTQKINNLKKVLSDKAADSARLKIIDDIQNIGTVQSIKAGTKKRSVVDEQRFSSFSLDKIDIPDKESIRKKQKKFLHYVNSDTNSENFVKELKGQFSNNDQLENNIRKNFCILQMNLLDKDLSHLDNTSIIDRIFFKGNKEFVKSITEFSSAIDFNVADSEGKTFLDSLCQFIEKDVSILQDDSFYEHFYKIITTLSKNKSHNSTLLRTFQGLHTKYLDDSKIKELYSAVETEYNLSSPAIAAIKDINSKIFTDQQDISSLINDIKKAYSGKKYVYVSPDENLIYKITKEIVEKNSSDLDSKLGQVLKIEGVVQSLSVTDANGNNVLQAICKEFSKLALDNNKSERLARVLSEIAKNVDKNELKDLFLVHRNREGDSFIEMLSGLKTDSSNLFKRILGILEEKFSTKEIKGYLDINTIHGNAGNSDVYKFISKKYIDKTATRVSSQFPLHNAVCTGKIDLVMRVLHSGEDIEKFDDDGHTPLAKLVLKLADYDKDCDEYRKLIEIAQRLVLLGANPRKKRFETDMDTVGIVNLIPRFVLEDNSTSGDLIIDKLMGAQSLNQELNNKVLRVLEKNSKSKGSSQSEDSEDKSEVLDVEANKITALSAMVKGSVFYINCPGNSEVNISKFLNDVSSIKKVGDKDIPELFVNKTVAFNLGYAEGSVQTINHSGREFRNYVVSEGSILMQAIWYADGEKQIVYFVMRADGRVEVAEKSKKICGEKGEKLKYKGKGKKESCPITLGGTDLQTALLQGYWRTIDQNIGIDPSIENESGKSSEHGDDDDDQFIDGSDFSGKGGGHENNSSGYESDSDSRRSSNDVDDLGGNGRGGSPLSDYDSTTAGPTPAPRVSTLSSPTSTSTPHATPGTSPTPAPRVSTLSSPTSTSTPHATPGTSPYVSVKRKRTASTSTKDEKGADGNSTAIGVVGREDQDLHSLPFGRLNNDSYDSGNDGSEGEELSSSSSSYRSFSRSDSGREDSGNDGSEGEELSSSSSSYRSFSRSDSGRGDSTTASPTPSPSHHSSGSGVVGENLLDAAVPSDFAASILPPNVIERIPGQDSLKEREENSSHNSMLSNSGRDNNTGRDSTPLSSSGTESFLSKRANDIPEITLNKFNKLAKDFNNFIDSDIIDSVIASKPVIKEMKALIKKYQNVKHLDGIRSCLGEFDRFLDKCMEYGSTKYRFSSPDYSRSGNQFARLKKKILGFRKDIAAIYDSMIGKVENVSDKYRSSQTIEDSLQEGLSDAFNLNPEVVSESFYSDIETGSDTSIFSDSSHTLSSISRNHNEMENSISIVLKKLSDLFERMKSVSAPKSVFNPSDAYDHLQSEDINDVARKNLQLIDEMIEELKKIFIGNINHKVADRRFWNIADDIERLGHILYNIREIKKHIERKDPILQKNHFKNIFSYLKLGSESSADVKDLDNFGKDKYKDSGELKKQILEKKEIKFRMYDDLKNVFSKIMEDLGIKLPEVDFQKTTGSLSEDQMKRMRMLFNEGSLGDFLRAAEEGEEGPSFASARERILQDKHKPRDSSHSR